MGLLERIVGPMNSQRGWNGTLTGSGPTIFVHKNGTNQTGVVSGVDTVVTWSVTDMNFHGDFDFSTNDFFPRVSGRYLFFFNITWLSGMTDQTLIEAQIANRPTRTGPYNVEPRSVDRRRTSGTGVHHAATYLLEGADGDKTYRAQVRQESGTNQTINGDRKKTFLMIMLLPAGSSRGQ